MLRIIRRIYARWVIIWLNSYTIFWETWYDFFFYFYCWFTLVLLMYHWSCAGERKYERSLSSLSFTFRREPLHRLFWDIAMCLFSIEWGKIRDSSTFSCFSHKRYLCIEKSKKSLVLRLHIVIDLEMYMDKFSQPFFYHSSEKMLECLEIFAMHADNQRRIRSLERDIEILSIFSNIERFYFYSSSCKKCSDTFDHTS